MWIKLYFCVFVFYGDCETSELCLCVFPVWASLCFDIPMQIVKHRGGQTQARAPVAASWPCLVTDSDTQAGPQLCLQQNLNKTSRIRKLKERNLWQTYKLLPSLIDEATLNVSKLCELNLECVLIGKAQHSLYRNCLKGTLVVIIIS